jgi:hypothetical protein
MKADIANGNAAAGSLVRQTSEPKLKVVFIGGSSRSGSTLLERLLARTEGFFAIGELHQIWRNSFPHNNLCACGALFRDCPFWTEVIRDSLGGFDQADWKAMRRLRHSVSRVWRKGALTRGLLSRGRYREELAAYAAVLEKILLAVGKHSGARVIVDSSKAAHHGRTLLASRRIDLRVVHIIRDSRAVAYSYRRVKQYPGPGGKTALMPRASLVRSSRLWRRENRCVEALGRLAPQFTTIRYEDLADRPAESLRSLLAWMNESPPPPDFLEGPSVELAPYHSLSGNPMRLKSGRIEVRKDAEWEQGMSPAAKLLVTALTLGMLRKYGYPLRW